MVTEYKGYKVLHQKESVIIKNVRDFNPKHTFECEQCFRWIRENDGSYTGVARERVINVNYEDGNMILSNTNLNDFQNIWFDYFDLGRDYTKIKEMIKRDEIMEAAIDYGYGIRILKQDFYETLISFIISANNMIPRIMRSVSSLSEQFGKEIKYKDKNYYAFPSQERLVLNSFDNLNFCGAGFRCKYIIDATKMMSASNLNFEYLHNLNKENAKKELIKLPGVGPKVADCVLLFSGISQNVFPIDVWVKRVMEELYFKKETGFKEIQEFAEGYFGELTGYAQQYLFYYARGHKIGTKRVEK